MDIYNTTSNVLKGMFRIGQTGKICFSASLNWLMGDRPPLPRVMRQTFEKLGATYIKLGQFIASSPSLFPAEYVEEFQFCLDKTKPVPFYIMKNVLKRDLKQPLYEVFSAIDPNPIASASIAMVYAAKLISGEDVVIKIQKPGVKDILLTDLNFLYSAAKILEFIAPGFSNASFSGIISEIQKTMMEECDFIKEAENIEVFDEFLQETENYYTVVPKVYHHATTTKVLTMERLYGVSLTDLESIKKYCSNPEQTLINALNTWFSSLFICDFFHADVHAGNLLVLEDGKVAFIDFGIVGKISKETWSQMLELIESISFKDFDKIAQAMINIGITSRKVETNKLANDLRSLSKKMEKIDPDELMQGNINEEEITHFMIELVELGENHGIRFPREFALLIKQFLYFDRYIKILAPELDLFNDERLSLIYDS